MKNETSKEGERSMGGRQEEKKKQIRNGKWEKGKEGEIKERTSE